jgi:acyl-CoA dehydrogenase
MADASFLAWPFFEDRHRALAGELESWCAANLPVEHGDVDAACRRLVAMLGEAGWLAHTAPELDVRSLALIRETLARHDALADFAFAMQGLGTGAITLYGSAEQRAWLERTREGGRSPPSRSPSRARARTSRRWRRRRRRTATAWVLEGEKTWISNGGIADLYTVFARTGEAAGARGLSAFLVPADSHGLVVAERLQTIAPHPLARLRFEGLRLPARR